MTPLHIFISSVQKEFARERVTLKNYLQSDPLLRRFFDVFLFEDVPARDQRADQLYLEAVRRCDIYLRLFGNEYGREDTEGISPTHNEFTEASHRGKHRLIFVKGTDDSKKHPKMQSLIRSADDQLVRRRFNTSAELITALYASLIQYLVERELIRSGPFDATFCRNATLDDLSQERVSRLCTAGTACPRVSFAGRSGAYRSFDAP